MYIVNEHGILHAIPDDWVLPEKTRKATDEEIGAFESTGEQNTKAKVVTPPTILSPNPQAMSTAGGDMRQNHRSHTMKNPVRLNF